jgi:uncharacterized protein (TIGR03435 family)
MKIATTVIFLLVCAITCGAAFAGALHGAQNPPVLMPPMVPAIPPPPPNAPPPMPAPAPNPARVAEAKRLAENISAYATAKCGGKDSAAAPDCWAKSLWDATQCPPEDASAKKDALANRDSPGSKDAVPAQKSCVPGGPGFEYDVISIKPHKDDGRNMTFSSGSTDGYRGTNMTMQNFVLNAFSTGLQIEIAGGPGWANDLRYDIEAKYVPEVGDAIKKLSRDDAGFVRRYMMQQVLKERTNFAGHVETKEVPSYDLVVGKNGLKMKASDPNAKDNGSMRMQIIEQAKILITGKGMAIAGLSRNLSNYVGRPVFDKTGLSGIYDITLEFAMERMPSASAPPGGAAGTPPDLPADPTGGPTVMVALEEQLGLKLVPSRGPMMLVVIEHMDKPDAN